MKKTKEQGVTDQQKGRFGVIGDHRHIPHTTLAVPHGKPNHRSVISLTFDPEPRQAAVAHLARRRLLLNLDCVRYSLYTNRRHSICWHNYMYATAMDSR